MIIDEKYNREFDIIFSKIWSENLSNIFVREICFPSFSTAVSHSHVIRISLCDYRGYSLVWLYQYGGGGHHSTSREGKQRCYGPFSRLLLTSYAFLYAETFSDFGKIGNLIYLRRNLFLDPEKC